MTYLLGLRKYLILASQLSGTILCIYFISQFQHYEISWYWTWILPAKVIELINHGLTMTGTLFLILPLTILIAAILIPDSLALKIASSLFGIASSLAVLLSGFFSNSMLESYNMKMFIITKILSLEEKRGIFIDEFQRFILLIKDSDLQSYLKNNILAENFILYDETLDMLKERLAIKVYASDTVHYLVSVFNQEKQIEVVSHLSTYVRYGCYFLAGVVLVIGTTTLLRYFFSTSDIIDGFSLTKKSAELSLKGVENNKASLDEIRKFLQEFLRMLPELLTKKEFVPQLNRITTGFDNVMDNLAKEELARLVFQKELITRILYLEKIVKKIMKHVNYNE
jgi:hypothetical protein